MLIGFLIPSYVLILSSYGWWIYVKIVFKDHLFESSDLLVYAWFFFVVYFHLNCIRTINSRYGYNSKTFVHPNKVVQFIVYLFAIPLVMLDWQCARNFSFYMAQTFARLWFLVLPLQVAMCASTWAVLSSFMDYTDDWQYFGWVFFSTCLSVLMLTQFPIFLKLWVFLVYLIPFVIYLVIYIIMWPFTKCCRCARTLMCMRDHTKEDKAEIGENDSQKGEAEYEGGDEEDPAGTERNINADGYYDRADRYLETDAELNRTKKTKKTRKGKKRKTPSKAANNAVSKDAGSKSKDTIDSGEKNQKKRDLRNLHELGFFNRVWRCLQPKYCSKCDLEIRCHHEEYVCPVGHVLHRVDCSKVKWMGNKVCPLCNKPPATCPPELDPNYGKENVILDEEVDEDIHEEPMKPNAV